jgi:hypothetical protein
LSEQSNNDINEISGINAANFGVTQSQESGKLNELRQVQGITTNTGVFDNFDLSMKLLGELLVGAIRSTEVYTEQEMENIVEEFDIYEDSVMAEANEMLNKANPIPSLQEALQMAEAEDPESQQKIILQYQQLLQQRQTMAMDIAKKLVMEEIHNIYKGRYGVAIAMSNFSPTAKNANMQMMFEISRLAPGSISPEEMIEMSDLPNKQPILKKMQARAKAAQEAAINAQRTEIEGKLLLQKLKNQGDVEVENTKSRNNIIEDKTTSK